MQILKECPFCQSFAKFLSYYKEDTDMTSTKHHTYRVECSYCEAYQEEMGEQLWSWWSDDIPLENEDDLKAKYLVIRRWNREVIIKKES